MNVFSIVVSCVSMCGTLVAIFFAVKGGQRTSVSEIEERVAESTRMNMKLDSIVATTNSIDQQISKINDSIQKHNEKFVKIDAKIESLEKRLDKVEKDQ